MSSDEQGPKTPGNFEAINAPQAGEDDSAPTVRWSTDELEALQQEIIGRVQNDEPEPEPEPAPTSAPTPPTKPKPRPRKKKQTMMPILFLLFVLTGILIAMALLTSGQGA